MKKTIIIDDRTERMKLHLSSDSISKLEDLVSKGFLKMSDGQSLTKNTLSVLDDFDLIAVHRSFLTKHTLFIDFVEYVKKSEKRLVVFSGGITQNSVLLDGRHLNINSYDFYNEKLVPFVTDFGNESITAANPLLYFLYGECWRLTLLLQYRYLLWEYDDPEEIVINGSKNDIEKEDYLRTTLWADKKYRTLEEVSKEIEFEKLKIQNL